MTLTFPVTLQRKNNARCELNNTASFYEVRYLWCDSPVTRRDSERHEAISFCRKGSRRIKYGRFYFFCVTLVLAEGKCTTKRHRLGITNSLCSDDVSQSAVTWYLTSIFRSRKELLCIIFLRALRGKGGLMFCVCYAYVYKCLHRRRCRGTIRGTKWLNHTSDQSSIRRGPCYWSQSN